jgi:hypothetical protein
MVEALHLGSMLPAALGACCVAGGSDRRSAFAWLGMLTMLAAMTDAMLLPRPVLPAVAWAAVLVALAMATAMRARLGYRVRGGSRAAHPPMAVHRALQALLMAGLVIVMTAHRHAPSSLATAGAGHDAHSGHPAGATWLPVALVAAALVFACYSVRLTARRGSARLDRAEAALGGFAVAAMTAAALV